MTMPASDRSVSRERSPARSNGRNRSYSRSPHRQSRSRYRDDSYSDDSYTDYSDDSYSDQESRAGKRNTTNAKPVNTNAGRKPAGKGSFQAKGGKKNTGRISKNKGMSPRMETDNVTKRMLSARRVKINELKNEIEDLNGQLTELRTENKLMRRQQALQARALDRYEIQESDMPQIILKHAEEVRILKEQLRKQKDKYKTTEKKLHDTGDELSRTQRLLKKMKGLVEDKKLGERDDLSQKLSKAESDLDDKDKRVKNLERHIEHLNKNHKHELGIERARHKETQRRLLEMQEGFERMQITLREKEKELDVRNIYAQRLMKPPHKLSSALNSTASSPAPSSNNRRQRKTSEPSMTPREKAKMFEMKKREEQRKQREAQASQIGSISVNVMVPNHEDKSGFKRESPSKHMKSQPGSKEEQASSPNDKENLYPEDVLQFDNIKQNKTTSQSVYEMNSLSGPQGDVKFLENSKPEFAENEETVDQNKDPGSHVNFWEVAVRTPSANKPVNASITDNVETQFQRTLFSEDSSPIQENSVDGSDVRNASKSPTAGSCVTRKSLTSKPFSVSKNRTFNKPPAASGSGLGEYERLEREALLREQEQKERELWEQKEQERLSKQEDLQHQADLDEEEDERKRWQEERERLKKEAENVENLRREKQTREEKYKRQQDEREQREREKNQRETEEREQKEKEQREREEKERRQKEEIERKAQDERDRLANNAAEQERIRQKELLLAKMREIDENGQSSDSTLSPSAKRRNYSFTKPTENLHHGKPAYDDVSVPVLEKTRKKGFLDDDNDSSGGGYQPSFTSSKNNTRASRNRKSDLMNDLFGSPASKPQPERQDSGLYFGSPKGGKNQPSSRNRDSSSSAAFGVGGAQIDSGADDPSSSQLLPRRQRQAATTIHSRPTINAIDDVDDDIEEVVL